MIGLEVVIEGDWIGVMTSLECRQRLWVTPEYMDPQIRPTYILYSLKQGLICGSIYRIRNHLIVPVL